MLNSFQYAEVEEFTPYYEFTPLWNVYFDQSTYNQKAMSYVFELHEMTKNELLDLADREDFKGDVIIEYLRTLRSGDYQKRPWETELQASSSTLTSSTMPDASTYEVIEYYGKVERKDLVSNGLIDADENDSISRDIMANVWIAGDKIIKFAVVDGIPYHAFYFEKDESSPYGTGLPEVMSDSQHAYNAAYREMLDNAALTAVAQVEVNRELLIDGVSINDMYAGKVWVRDGRGAEANISAVRPVVLPSHTNEFLTMMAKIEALSDSESHMPEGLFGEAARRSNETATAMSIRQGNNNQIIDSLVRNFDRCNESVISSAYEWNMRYNPDKNIKGDYNVTVRGSSDLMAKEMKANSLTAVLNVVGANPLLMQEFQKEVNIGSFFKEILNTHGLSSDNILLTDVEKEQREKEQLNAGGGSPQQAQQAAQMQAQQAQPETLPAQQEAPQQGVSNPRR